MHFAVGPHNTKHFWMHFIRDSGTTWREKAVEAWHATVANIWDNVALSHLSPREWMVCSTPSYDDAVSPSMFPLLFKNIPIFYSRILQRLEVKALWSPPLWPDALVWTRWLLLPRKQVLRKCQGWTWHARKFFASVHCMKICICGREHVALSMWANRLNVHSGCLEALVILR